MAEWFKAVHLKCIVFSPRDSDLPPLYQVACKLSRAEIPSEIKLAILKKAAQLTKEDLIKTKEKNSDVNLPKAF